MQDLGAHLVVDALLDAMIADGRAAQGDLRRVPRPAFRAPPTSSRASRGPGRLPGRHSTARWKRSRSSSRSGASTRTPTSSAISSTRATPATSSTTRSCSTRFSASAARSLSATSRAAGGALYLLYTHDDQRQQLIDDPALIPDAIEECLRLGSNGYFTFPRIATKDTEVGGTRILKGMVVRPSPLSPNYDPDVFPDPLRFDIHRKPKRILSFGAGPASLHRQHPRPHHDHHRDHAAAGALSEGAYDRSELHAGLWRRGRRIAAAKPADADPLNSPLSSGSAVMPGAAKGRAGSRQDERSCSDSGSLLAAPGMTS